MHFLGKFDGNRLILASPDNQYWQARRSQRVDFLRQRVPELPTQDLEQNLGSTLNLVEAGNTLYVFIGKLILVINKISFQYSFPGTF